ncbi:MAG: metallophosphoesterase [Myxococcota bacterium]
MIAVLVCLAAGACKGDPGHPTARQTAIAASSSEVASPPSPDDGEDAQSCAGLAPLATRFPAAERIVAIGDVHGDLAATRAAFRLAGAIDEQDRWIGGRLVVVQTGDLLDRGDDEQAILDLLKELAIQARAAGGALHVLNGNHEFMNARGDFRYITPGGFADFRDAAGLDLTRPQLETLPSDQRARAAAFLPGGPYARLLAGHNTIVMVGDTVFVHGGVLPEHAKYGIERINREARCWLQGGGQFPEIFQRRAVTSPVWSREYSAEAPACDTLEKTLAMLGAARMVVGHTVQRSGINAACDRRVWRIDVGMAAHYGGSVQVLEIRGSTVRVLRETAL